MKANPARAGRKDKIMSLEKYLDKKVDRPYSISIQLQSDVFEMLNVLVAKYKTSKGKVISALIRKESAEKKV